MDITQYRPDALLTSQDINRARAKQVADATTSEVQPVAPISGEPPPAEEFSLFDTLIDTVNPLQHIPGVSTAYQAITGDDSNALAQMAGGYLFGGPVGLAAGAANSFLEFLTGEDLLGNVMALFDGEETLPEDGLEHIETASTKDFEALFRSGTSKGVEQYQAFAQAEAQQNAGTGASRQDVNWSSNIWTSKALKDAASLYEGNQNRANPSSPVDERRADQFA